MRGLSRLLVVPIVALAGSVPLALPARPIHRDTSSTVTLPVGRDPRSGPGTGGPGTATLDLRTISGSIHVTTERRADVRLTITRHTSAERESDVAIADRDVRLVTEATGNTVAAIVHDGDAVCGESHNDRRDSWWERRRYDVSVELTADVPEGMRIRLCTVNSDAVIATGSFADFDVSNVNGRIELSGVRGSGRAVTVNGPVKVTFTESPRDASEFTTVNGDVMVTFPGDLSADLRLKTMHGELFTDFDYQPLPIAPEVIRSTAKGNTVYRLGPTRVRIGRGGPELSFDTLNGDVRIARAAR